MVLTTDINNKDLQKRLSFIAEAGKLQTIIRQTYLHDSKRYENSAEHSWHLILMAIVLKDYANENIDLTKVIKMLAIHDLGEIYGGDTFLYAETRDEAGIGEREALHKLLENTPNDIKEEILDLWEEFEAKETAEAKFAESLDRFQPTIKNLQAEGQSWLKHKITRDKALSKNQHIKNGSSALWKAYKIFTKKAKDLGFFHKG